MKSFNNVEMFRGKSFLLFFLLSFIFLIVSIIFLKEYVNVYFLLLLGLLIIFILYLKNKNKFFYKLNFKIFENKFSYDENDIIFNEIESYKVEYMRGATLNLKLKSGKKINFSSNDNFCNAENFIFFCKSLDKRLKNYEGSIIRKKSFLETKFGLYFVYLLTFAFLLIILMSIFTEKKINIATLGLIIISISALWGAILERKK